MLRAAHAGSSHAMIPLDTAVDEVRIMIPCAERDKASDAMMIPNRCNRPSPLPVPHLHRTTVYSTFGMAGRPSHWPFGYQDNAYCGNQDAAHPCFYDFSTRFTRSKFEHGKFEHDREGLRHHGISLLPVCLDPKNCRLPGGGVFKLGGYATDRCLVIVICLSKINNSKNVLCKCYQRDGS